MRSMKIRYTATATIFTIVCIAGSSLAQQPPPPPIARTVSESSTRLFESKDGGFKIAFPSNPTFKSSQVDSSFGKASINTYYLPTTFAEYVVVYMDFPTVLSEKFDLDTRFDAMRDAQVKSAKGKVISEVEIQYGSYYGRQFTVETGHLTYTTRTIAVEQRIFILTVTTKGSLSRQSEKLQASNESRITKFLDSFTVTNISKPVLSQVPLPADFGIQITGRRFYSRFFDISLDFPMQWNILNAAENELLTELGKEEVTRTKPKLVDYLKGDTTRILGGVSRHNLETEVNNAVLLIAAERAPYPNFLPIAIANTYVKLFLDPNEKVVKPPSTQVIGGVQFAWLETYDPTSKITQRFYFANRKGIVFEIVLSFMDSSQLEPMLQSLQTLKTDVSAGVK